MELGFTNVRFDYYRDSGKFYSEGELDIPYENGKEVPFWEVMTRVREMLEKGKRPGLVDGREFNTLVTVHTHYGFLSAMLVREKDGSLRHG